jgi:hypothetical protein
MNIGTALNISYVALAVSAAAAVLEIASRLLHFDLPVPLQFPALILSFVWPLAFYAVAMYRKKQSGR